MQKIGGKVRIPENTGDFRILNRAAMNALCTMRENHRFMKGLFTQIGFKQTSLLYDRDPRYAGKTKWKFWKLVSLSIEGLISFTIMPLRVATIIGAIISIGAFISAARIIHYTISHGDPVAGWPSLMTVVLFLGGIQLLTIGIIGEYLGRIFNETKHRPLYFIRQSITSNTTKDLSYISNKESTIH